MNRGPKPLSGHAVGVLRDIAQAPKPCSEINAGVSNKFLAEGLAEVVQIRSPYQAHKGRMIAHLQATAAGRERIEEHA